jgi:hypothetical protein
LQSVLVPGARLVRRLAGDSRAYANFAFLGTGGVDLQGRHSAEARLSPAMKDARNVLTRLWRMARPWQWRLVWLSNRQWGFPNEVIQDFVT